MEQNTETDKTQPVRVSTDGSYQAETGVGAWAWSCESGRRSWGTARCGVSANHMEARAVLSALHAFRDARRLTVATDALHLTAKIALLRQGRSLGRCAPTWRALLREIGAELDAANLQGRQVELVWVKGHSGDAGNMHADRMASRAARRANHRARQRVSKDAAAAARAPGAARDLR